MLFTLFGRRRPPVAVVLGAGMHQDGTPAQATRLRAEAAARLAAIHPEIRFIILSGNGPNDRPRDRTEAAVMADVLAAAGICRSRMLLEEESIDTIGNAVLVAARYLHRLRPRRLYLVTSPFHLERATLMFGHVLGKRWEIVPVACDATPVDSQRARSEAGGIAWAKQFFAGVTPGDLAEIIGRLQQERPYYQTLGWLAPERFQRPRSRTVWRKRA